MIDANKWNKDRQTIEKIIKTQFFQQINDIDNLLARVTKEKEEGRMGHGYYCYRNS